MRPFRRSFMSDDPTDGLPGVIFIDPATQVAMTTVRPMPPLSGKSSRLLRRDGKEFPRAPTDTGLAVLPVEVPTVTLSITATNVQIIVGTAVLPVGRSSLCCSKSVSRHAVS